VTTGASNDLERATDLSRRLVTRFGMSDLGPMTFGKNDELVFLGKELHEQKNYSEKIAEKIDQEVEKIIKTSFEKTCQILEQKSRLLKKIAEELLEKETLEKEEFEALIKEEPEEKKQE
jgi:cell division protease FtsH